jgi:hypothetical protein
MGRHKTCPCQHLTLVPDSWFSVLSSQFSVLGSWFLVLGSWFPVPGSWSSHRRRFFLFRQLTQHVVQDTAVPVVGEFAF